MKRTNQRKNSPAEFGKMPSENLPAEMPTLAAPPALSEIDPASVVEQDALAHIRDAAYFRWEAAGCPCGDGQEFWLDAEREYLAARAIPSPSGTGDVVQEASEESFPASDPPARSISRAEATVSLSGSSA